MRGPCCWCRFRAPARLPLCLPHYISKPPITGCAYAQHRHAFMQVCGMQQVLAARQHSALHELSDALK